MTGANGQFFCSGHGAFQKVLIHSDRIPVLFGTFLIYQIKDLVSIIIAADTLTEFQLDSSLVRGSLHTDNVARRQQKKQKQKLQQLPAIYISKSYLKVSSISTGRQF